VCAVSTGQPLTVLRLHCNPAGTAKANKRQASLVSFRLRRYAASFR
jgi:hypothetical protein